MDGWHHQLDGHEFEQALGVGDGQQTLAYCSPRERKELDTTEQLNWLYICIYSMYVCVCVYAHVCVHTHHIFLYPFIYWQTLRLFPQSWLLKIMLRWTGWSRYFFQVGVFVYSGKIPRSRIAELYGSFIFKFLKNLDTVTILLHHFIYTPTMHKGSLLPTLFISCLIDDSYSAKYEAVSHCGFDLHISDK